MTAPFRSGTVLDMGWSSSTEPSLQPVDRRGAPRRFAALGAVGLLAVVGAPERAAGRLPAGGLPAVQWVQGQTAYDSLLDGLLSLGPDPTRTFIVEDAIVERDAAQFTLRSGSLVLFQPLRGRTVAAVFTGYGELIFEPPIDIEREHLVRTYGTPTLERTFRSLVLLFADSTAFELEATGAHSPGDANDPGGARDTYRDALRYFVSEKRRYAAPAIIAPLLNDEWTGMFTAVVEGVENGPFLVQLDPERPEQVSLSRGDRGRTWAERGSEVVNRFPQSAGQRVGSADWVHSERVSVFHYDLGATIATDLDFSARAALELGWSDREPKWFSLDLFHELEVDSMRWDGVGPAEFARGEETGTLWIRTPGAGSTWPRLTMFYHGELFHEGRSLRQKSYDRWYPTTGRGYGRPSGSTFDLSFAFPAKYRLVAVGALASDTLAGDVRRTEWITSRPVAHATFNIGEYADHEVEDARVPPVTVLVRRGWPRVAEAARAVGEDVALSLNFFQDVFGPPRASRFYAVEVPGFLGRAFPGLLHLSSITYSDPGFRRPTGAHESFRAHEMAHQWWGLGVTPKSYRDAWISEGFAEFAGWWYTQVILNDEETFSKMLEASRDALLHRRAKMPPIAFGTRALSSEHPRDYPLAVYHKGAWVIHMLRHLMLDPDTQGDQPFRRLMRDFYATYRGVAASTEDFQETVERHIGVEMDWFFRSWVYRSEIPTYEWAYEAERLTDSQTSVRFRVETSRVPEDFMMMVPVLLEFEDGRWALFKQLVKGPHTAFDVTVLEEPSEVVFNPFHAVLAQVKRVGW